MRAIASEFCGCPIQTGVRSPGDRDAKWGGDGTHHDACSAQADGAQLLAQAAGEAWSFLTLQAQHGVAPDEFFFRRRLETLERSLMLHRFTILDARFQRDGGELWMTP